MALFFAKQGTGESVTDCRVSGAFACVTSFGQSETASGIALYLAAKQCQQCLSESVIPSFLVSSAGVIKDLTKAAGKGHFTGDFAACHAMGL